MNTETLWKNILEELKISVSKATFQTVFLQTRLLSLENNIANIACHSGYIQRFIEDRYYSLIKDAIDRQTKSNNSLIFTIKPFPSINSGVIGPLFSKNMSDQNINTYIKTVANLKSDYTFDNFAVSSSNQLPFAAATAVAKNIGTAYNPLFLWGGVGVGKTHLMHAIAHEALKNNPNLKIICSPGEEFTNEIVNAIKNKTTDLFKKKYRSANLLLLDDVQFIAGKETIQEEFFHTFNAIHTAGGQIVLTSDRPPGEIAKLEERLRSRFEAGLIVDIPNPDFELRTAILLIKLNQRKINLDMDQAQLIAANIDMTRKMEGFLTRLITEVETKKIPITNELITSLLEKSNPDIASGVKIIKPKEVIEKIAEYYNIKTSQLKSPTRVKGIVFPRHILMYLLKIELKLPYMEIGEVLGGRNHTTIMHGVNKITNLLKDNEDLRVDISKIKQRLL